MPKYKVTIRESTFYTYEVEAWDVDIAEDEGFDKHLHTIETAEKVEASNPEVVEVKLV